MPDENTNPVGTTQISQNNQVTTNSSGNDFVLDFGEEKVEKDDKVSEVEINDLQEEKEQEEIGTDVKFDDDIFNEEGDKNDLEYNDGVLEDNVDNEEPSNDFDISLEDNNEEMEDNNEEIEDNNEEIEDNNEEIEDNNEEMEDNNEEIEDNNEEIEDNNEEIEDTNDFNISLDENLDNNTKEQDDNENFLLEDNENSGETNQDNNDIEAGNDTREENNDTYVDSGILNDSDVTDEGGIINENPINLGESENETTQNSTSNLGEESTSNDVNSIADVTQEPLTQPEIGDLLGNSSNNFSMEESDGDTVGSNNNESLEINQESNNVQGIVNIEPESEESNDVVEEKQNFVDNNTENQSFTMDYSIDDENGPRNDGNDEVYNENIEGSNNLEKNVASNENNVNTDTNQIENTDQTVSQQISTLSLDQILDTELNNNPQYADNSKAVPINVPDNKGLFGNKKLVGIVTGIGLFLLVGVGMIISPLGSSNKKQGVTVDTGQIIEEYVDDHQVADFSEDLEENSSMDEGIEEGLQGEDTSVHESKVTIQQDFPDVDWEDESSSLTNDDRWDLEGGDIEPYVSSEEENTKQSQELEIRDVLLTISDYESEAEIYYTQGDEMQDKKLIKYSLQAISLCDDYKEQVQNGESLDEESFLSFKSKIDKILTKMEEYLGGDNYTEFY